jgi:putative acetyltransferase
MIVYIPFEPKYKEQVINLIIDIQQNEFQVPITIKDQPDLQIIPDFYQIKNGNFWVALHEEKVVGTIALIDCGEGVACIRKMFVHKDFRSKYSIAQTLLDTLVAQCKAYNFKAIYLGTRGQLQAAIRFYERNSFILVPSDTLPLCFPKMAVDTHFFKLKLENI